ncbi:D-ribitol-5-phosphate cytidylyltransferase-like [Mercenaria mercenaria]|uniref:D-ribitol-5-phosphate cytidylyltransferase-like n=1 Tax=Mercenaria mercenaria TaxID=6596 RepID=UPI00234E87A8|nr:D-ribitol-5-phosphate cytidylyltransferase-like [Mercenaria mercenaria]
MDEAEETTSTVDFDVSVVLPAGGCGERFGCDLPKQYSLLIDQPVILHTIKAFHRITWIKRIAVVVNAKFLSYMDQLVLDNKLDKVVVVKGCTTRHRSIYAGVKILAKDVDMSSVVIIHDAVRPFIDEKVIQKIAVYARSFGAAGVTRPLVSTVISADDEGLLRESLDRSRYCASEMPQGFQLSVIKTAYEKSDDHDFDYGTECLLLAMKYTGTRAKLLTGPDNLWKVTYRKDLYAAEAIVKEQNVTVQVNFTSCQVNKDLKEAIFSKCRSKSLAVKENTGLESVICNSVVFIYSNFSTSAIFKNTKCVQTSAVDSDITMTTPLRSCVVHVYDGNLLDKDDIFIFMKTVSEAMENIPDILIFGILHFNVGDYNKLSDMVTSLVWNRDPTMCGQTFVIHKSKNKTHKNSEIQ